MANRTKVKRRSVEKRITTYSGREAIAQKTYVKFGRSRHYSKSKKALEKTFDETIAPEFVRFVKRKQKNTSRQFILRIQLNKNLKGKRLRSGFSTFRNRVSNRSVKEYLKDLKKSLIESLDQYLKRKDMRSITITGFDMEVLKYEKSRKNSKKLAVNSDSRSKRQKP